MYLFERGLKKKLNVAKRVGLGFALSLKRHIVYRRFKFSVENYRKN